MKHIISVYFVKEHLQFAVYMYSLPTKVLECKAFLNVR